MPDYSTMPVRRWHVMPPRVAYPLMLLAATMLVAAGQVLNLSLGLYLQGRQNANPSFIFTQLDVCCMVLWFVAVVGLVLILIFTRRAPRAVAAILLLTCICAITPLQCKYRQMPLDRYEAGFLQWTSAHVAPAPIAAWQATLPPVTKQTTLPPSAWPPAVAFVQPTTVIQDPGGIILEWGMIGAWGNSRRVFIGANGSTSPPTNDQNILFNWKKLGPGFFAAYQTTD